MLYDKRISLDPRLSMIAEMLGVCICCADIGSDHGRLGAFLLQNRRCDTVCLTDISEKSLMKARSLIGLLGYEDRVEFRVGDGANALNHPVDAAVIAGMGGETIAHIIAHSNGMLDGAKMVLQPNVAAKQLRECLAHEGWKIIDEAFAKDGRRIYPVICAEKGSMSLDEREALIGPVFLKKRPALLEEYRQFRLRVLNKALRGASVGTDLQNIEELKREIEIWEGI